MANRHSAHQRADAAIKEPVALPGIAVASMPCQTGGVGAQSRLSSLSRPVLSSEAAARCAGRGGGGGGCRRRRRGRGLWRGRAVDTGSGGGFPGCRGSRCRRDDLGAFAGDDAVDDARIGAAGSAAPAQDLDLEQEGFVGEFEQALGAGEHAAAEVGCDAEGVDVELGVVDELGELFDLVLGEELGLVDDEVVDAGAGGPGVADHLGEVGVVVDLNGWVLHVDAGAVCGLNSPRI